jgi:hypothetical protein
VRFVNRGTLVVQYDAQHALPAGRAGRTYPLDIGRGRVTTNAELRALTPRAFARAERHRARTSRADQERGLYFGESGTRAINRCSSWPIERPPQRGALWSRATGAGATYTGLSFFRQLPAGVPGASAVHEPDRARFGAAAVSGEEPPEPPPLLGSWHDCTRWC